MPQERLLPPTQPKRSESVELSRISAFALSLDLGVKRCGNAYVVRTRQGQGWILGARQSLFALEAFLLRLKEQWREHDE